MHWLDVPFQRQLEPSWCLPACVCMVAAYLEQPLLQEDVARWLDTQYLGTPASRVQRLTQRGFSVIYREGSLNEVRRLLDEGVPPIVFVQAGELSYWDVDTWHALVLVGIDEGTVQALDPMHGEHPVKIEIDELMLAWSHFDYKYAALQVA